MDEVFLGKIFILIYSIEERVFPLYVAAFIPIE